MEHMKVCHRLTSTNAIISTHKKRKKYINRKLSLDI